MAKHKYVSLKDVVKDQSIPKIEPNVGSEDEPDYSKKFGNPSSPSSPPFSFLGSSSNINEKGKSKKDVEKKKKILRSRSSSLRHSRSDDPLVYVKCTDGDAFDDLNSLSQEMKNFSWEERTLKSNIRSESEEEEEKKEK